MARYSAARRYGGGDPAIKVIFEKNGNWHKIHQIIHRLPATLRVAMMAGQRSVAKKFKAEILKAIRSNSYPEKKQAQGGGLFVFTGSYKRNIKIITTNSNRIYVGIKKGVRGNNKSRLTISEYANILEQGSVTRGIVPRPLWRDTWRKFGGKKRAIRIIEWHIRATYLKQHGLILR